jgi:thiol-disulfide isomerase/thioredoxin
MFVITDIDTKLSLKLANFFGFREASNLPSIKFVEYEENEFKKFSFSRNITKTSILGFIQKWKVKGLRTYRYQTEFESDLIRLSNNSLVKKVNYNSLYDSVNLNKKNVIVFFYTEWCSHCKKV